MSDEVKVKFMKRVYFDKNSGCYNPGEVAGFDDETAEHLCGGPNPVARYADEDGKPIVVTKDPEKKKATKKVGKRGGK